jgi:hypothetical protein
LINPGSEQRDLIETERLTFAGRRHFGIFDQPADEVDKFTFFALTGKDDEAVFAALERMLAGVEEELALGFLGAVTGQTGGLEDWLNVCGEINGPVSGRRQFRKADVSGKAAGDAEGEADETSAEAKGATESRCHEQTSSS